MNTTILILVILTLGVILILIGILAFALYALKSANKILTSLLITTLDAKDEDPLDKEIDFSRGGHPNRFTSEGK